jgi:choline dehydrogenase-like flavoprotein
MARTRKILKSKEAYDIVIVGAGAGGCVVASSLAEHTNASIALIEAGGLDRDPFIHIPADFANMFAHDRNVWKYETVPQHSTKRAYRSAKVLGGGSSINAMAYVRGQKRDDAACQEAAATPAIGRMKTCFPSSWRRKTTTPSTTNITA